ncbi:MAG: SPOR domain-containing protein [bacterium]|nr:SPOR domain-containing protein [bacterium]
MSESNETSYYEIALTNRQVLVAFVLILGCVLAAFLSGVWVGHKRANPEPAGEDETAAVPGETGELAEMEELNFFSEQSQGEEELDKPDLSRLLTQPNAETTLAQDVGSTGGSPPRREAPARAQPAGRDDQQGAGARRRPDERRRRQQRPESPSAATTPPATSTPPPEPPPSPPAQSTSPRPMEGFVVQVFSTRDEARARQLLGRLESGGYEAFLLAVEINGQTMYRVRIGPFPERSQAEATCDKVNTQYRLDTWVTAASN